MPRSVGSTVENQFTRGLITEATSLNFPENASTETWDCIFRPIGRVERRPGMDYEADHIVEPIDETGAVVEYVWRAASATGFFTLLAVQFGTSVVFYELQSGTSLSRGLKPFKINLSEFATATAAEIKDIPCQFASGNGRLFIVHPFVDPVFVEYDEEEDTIQTTRIRVKIRDHEGIEDALEIDEQPTNLTNRHWYNLKNQGWWKSDVRMVTAGGGAGNLASGGTSPTAIESLILKIFSDGTESAADMPDLLKEVAKAQSVVVNGRPVVAGKNSVISFPT